MSEEQPVPSLCQTPELSLHPEHVLRMGLGLVLGDVARSKLPGCRLHLLPQVQWSLASMCSQVLLLTHAAAAGLHGAPFCLVTLVVFLPLLPHLWEQVTFLSISAIL